MDKREKKLGIATISIFLIWMIMQLQGGDSKKNVKAAKPQKSVRPAKLSPQRDVKATSEDEESDTLNLSDVVESVTPQNAPGALGAGRYVLVLTIVS